MIRLLHRWPGLIAMALLVVLALSGAALSVFPVLERISAPQATPDLTVADLARKIQATYPGIEQIKRGPSGQITAYWFSDGTPGSAIIDPATGKGVGTADPNATERWLTTLHRSMFLDDPGRVTAAIGAAAMLMLSLSGGLLVRRRVGGWRNWFTPLRGPMPGRWHVEVARVAVAGLALSSATALWMTASTFDLLPISSLSVSQTEASGKVGFAAESIPVLTQTPVSTLRELSFPYADDPTDVFTLVTDQGTSLIDQGNGAVISQTGLTTGERISEIIFMLHTGQGASLLGLLLGLMALGVPVLSVTGTLIWLAGRRARPKISGNVAAGRAETVLLVGSESGSTWGFAATLYRGLTDAGQQVHVAAMSAFDPARYTSAKRVVILAATYGDGVAPASAKGFIERLAALRVLPDVPLAVLGFGDRTYPAFSAFGANVAQLAKAKGWAMLLPYDAIDRQSAQEFARWGRLLGGVLGLSLELAHKPVLPECQMLTLQSRRDYGAEVQAPTAILRFDLPKPSVWHRLTGQGFSGFQAGDLLGIVPEGSPVPRLYSLASGCKDGFVEIVVRKLPDGVCSRQLVSLDPGDKVAAFLRRNPAFHAGSDRAPLILIGAGTGVGPLAGFVRSNRRRRPIHVFFGLRHPESDFLYEPEFSNWKAAGKLSRLITAVSRGTKPYYVQDALRGDAAQVGQLIRSGARVMVCGGREMAAGVRAVLTEIMAPFGLTPAKLMAEGRYVEDVY